MVLVIVGLFIGLLFVLFLFASRRKNSNLELVDNEEEEYDRFFGAPW